MGRILQHEQMRNRLTENINRLLENQEARGDAKWWEEPRAQECLQRMAAGNELFICTSDMLEITQEGDEKRLVFVRHWDLQKPRRDMLQEYVNCLVEDPKTNSIQMVFFVKDLHDRIALEETFDKKLCRDIAAVAKRTAGKKDTLYMIVTCVLIQEYSKQPVKLTRLQPYELVSEPPIDGRINLEPGKTKEEKEAPEDQHCNIQAVTFAADLYQLVELYNLVGEQLFRNNVRFGIEEKMGVDYSIQQTLREKPWQFYYKNNGITILADCSASVLACTDEIILGEIGPDRLPNFSVVNGAQTITAAAQYFFRLQHQQKDGKRSETERKELKNSFEESKKWAKVPVRVIQIPEGVEGERLVKEISVALNRQKPILMEDIAFTSPDVHKLSEYLWDRRNSGAPFQLIRRGEGVKDSRYITLIEFVRARIACAGSPGPARNKGGDDLLKTRLDEGRYCFVRDDIFADDWLGAEGDEETAVFGRDYGAVFYAHLTAQEYEKCARTIQTGEVDYLGVVRNGKWYFTALLVQLLNGFRMQKDGKTPDFSRFSGTVEEIQEKIPRAIDPFAHLTALCVSQGKEVNSNLFKGDELYEDIIRGMRDGFASARDGSGPQKRELFRQLTELFQAPPVEASVEELNGGIINISKANGDQIDGSQIQVIPKELEQLIAPSGNYVVVDGVIHAVENDAEAFARIAEYILRHFPVPKAVIKENCRTWLTSDYMVVRAGVGSFRGNPRRIQVDTEHYWVGTSINTESKCRNLRTLCSLANVPEGTIRWKKKGRPGYTFIW